VRVTLTQLKASQNGLRYFFCQVSWWQHLRRTLWREEELQETSNTYLEFLALGMRLKWYWVGFCALNSAFREPLQSKTGFFFSFFVAWAPFWKRNFHLEEAPLFLHAPTADVPSLHNVLCKHPIRVSRRVNPHSFDLMGVG